MSDNDHSILLQCWSQGAKPKPGRPILHFAPEGRRAAFVITDHGDRTKLAPVTALYMGHSDPGNRLWGRTGLIPLAIRITQATFWSGYPGYDYLDQPEFLRLMQMAFAHGAEICPHNTSENVLQPWETVADLERFEALFGLTTFIDHAHLPSNLTRGGADPQSPYYILDRFLSLGGRAAWSYEDVVANPPSKRLDMCSPPSLRSMVASIAKRPWGRTVFETRVAGVLNSLVGSWCVYHAICALRQERGGARLAAWSKAFGSCVSHLGRRRSSFPFRWDKRNGVYWFDSVRVNLTNTIYSPDAIDQLIAQNGIHVGHTYLSLSSGRRRSQAIERDGDHWRISSAMSDFLQHLSARVNQGQVWNPTIRTMVEFLDQLSSVRVGAGSNIVVQNTGSETIKGLTLRSANPLRWDCSSDLILVGSEYWYVLDLQSKAAVIGREVCGDSVTSRFGEKCLQ
jgi:hypothetical protein